MAEKKYIKESDKEQDAWYKEASEMTLEKLPEFLKRLTEDYSHDMNTICHALVAGALGVIKAMDKTEEGGIGKTQQQKVLALFVQKWCLLGDGPIKILSWLAMLHPRHEKLFTGIPKKTMDVLQFQAKGFIEEIKQEEANGVKQDPTLLPHLEILAAGKAPWGLVVDENQ